MPIPLKILYIASEVVLATGVIAVLGGLCQDGKLTCLNPCDS